MGFKGAVAHSASDEDYVFLHLKHLIFIILKRSLGQGNVFTAVCLSTGGIGFPACITFHMTSIGGGSGGGSWLPSKHHRSHGQGGLYPDGDGSASWGMSAYGGAGGRVGQTPFPLKLGKRAVWILLECFLVNSVTSQKVLALLHLVFLNV